jgi:hypothetical protein
LLIFNLNFLTMKPYWKTNNVLLSHQKPGPLLCTLTSKAVPPITTHLTPLSLRDPDFHLGPTFVLSHLHREAPSEGVVILMPPIYLILHPTSASGPPTLGPAISISREILKCALPPQLQLAHPAKSVAKAAIMHWTATTAWISPIKANTLLLNWQLWWPNSMMVLRLKTGWLIPVLTLMSRLILQTLPILNPLMEETLSV